LNHRISLGFDFLAPFYDRLACIMIGKDIVNAQLHFLACFKECNWLLILGGGSGWILDLICKECPNLEIDYIDVSPAMLELARKRVENNKRVNFIQGTENDIPNRLYDGVITNFYLDMFNEKSLNVVMVKIKRSLRTSALWVVTDFVKEGKAHALKLWLMYRFFRTVARIEASCLPDWQNQMKLCGSKLLVQKIAGNGFIKSNLYQITSPSK
jgi:ubiquinone/menaquinone biosynthesis C-methylase UbiE